MSIRIHIAPEIWESAGKPPAEAPLEIHASNVLEAMETLFKRVPDLMPRLLDPGGGHYRAHLHVNGKDIRFLQYLDTPLSGDDELHILPVDFSNLTRKSLYLTFEASRVNNPILHHAGRMFNVEVNILGARVTARKGFIHALLVGPEGELDLVLSWLSQNGVRVDEAD